MTTIPDEQLLTHASRAKGKVVVLTGGASGIGKAAAIEFARHGAKVVIGDIDFIGAETTVAEIVQQGGTAIAQKTDVLDWDAQCALFERAISTYGSVDIVTANAGINEESVPNEVLVVGGVPVKPSLKTLEVNLIGVIYTSHMAKHYLRQKRQPGSLKSLIMIGSMASWASIPRGPIYTASKHGVLGYMRSMRDELTHDDIHLACIHPWLANPSTVLTSLSLATDGTQAPIPRVAAAIVYAATNIEIGTNGCAFVLTDDGPVKRVDYEVCHEGVYGAVERRVQSVIAIGQGIKLTIVTLRDFGRTAILKLLPPVLTIWLGYRVYKNRGLPFTTDSLRQYKEYLSAIFKH